MSRIQSPPGALQFLRWISSLEIGWYGIAGAVCLLALGIVRLI